MSKYPITGHLTQFDHLGEEVSAKFLYCGVVLFFLLWFMSILWSSALRLCKQPFVAFNLFTSVWTLGFLSQSTEYKSLQLLFLLMLKLPSVRLFGASWKALLLPVSFCYDPSLLEQVINFWHNMLQAQFVLPPKSASFPRSSGSFEQRMVFRNHNVAAKCTQCYWGVPDPRPSWWTQLCTHTNTPSFSPIPQGSFCSPPFPYL